MSKRLASHALQRVLRLEPPLTRDVVVVHRDLRIPMPDGAVLLADRWLPRAGRGRTADRAVAQPLRRGMLGLGMALPLAERGYQVLIQSARGTFGSGGAFDPMRQERADGLATLEWLVEQPWFGEAIVLVGASYLGHAQWAPGDRLPPQVKAMIPQFTESAATPEFLRADGMSL